MLCYRCRISYLSGLSAREADPLFLDSYWLALRFQAKKQEILEFAALGWTRPLFTADPSAADREFPTMEMAVDLQTENPASGTYFG
jgi:hypothetical protein